jgi:hypothetical protein
VADRNLFLDISNFADLREIQWEDSTNLVTLHVDNTSAFLPELISRLNSEGCKISELRCRYVTLDDLFIRMTGRKLTD